MELLENLFATVPLVCGNRQDNRQEECIQVIERSLYQAFAAIGFEYVRYTCCMLSHADSSGFSHSFSFNFSNFPEGWERYYEINRCYLHDPVVQAMLENDQARLLQGTWQSTWKAAELAAVAAGEQDKVQHYFELQDQSNRHGILAGVYMMINNGQRRIVLSLGTGRSPQEVEVQADSKFYKSVFSAACISDGLLSLSSDCHRCKRVLRVGGGNPVRLTAKQARILKSFYENPSATNGDIAKLHHVTVEAVVFHLKAIRRKFCMPNTSGHVLANVAILHGLI